VTHLLFILAAGLAIGMLIGYGLRTIGLPQRAVPYVVVIGVLVAFLAQRSA
jgi:xanthosine utilization system XapX-like protein